MNSCDMGLHMREGTPDNNENQWLKEDSNLEESGMTGINDSYSGKVYGNKYFLYTECC